MAHPQDAVHRTIVAVDIEKFGDQRRTNQHHVAVRHGLYQALEKAFESARIPWSGSHREDRGDGALILVSAEVPKSRFVEKLPHALINKIREHNAAHSAERQIRLRMVLHYGEVTFDDHGVSGVSINLAFRLLEADRLKAALTDSPGVLVLIASPLFYDEVVRNSDAAAPDTWRRVPVAVKETSTTGWISRPDHPYPPDWWRRPRKRLVSGLVAGAVLIAVGVGAVALLPRSGDSTQSGSSNPSPRVSGTWYCSRVIDKNAPVYPKPDTSTRPVKHKALNDGVEVLTDYDSPSGWVAVRTPFESPGYQWMRRAVLTTPTPQSQYCPLRY